MQLLVPLAILLYFFLRADFFAVAFILFWIGDNLINISIYIKDARSMTLDLVGGGIHDWNFLLGKWGLLNSDQNLGGFVQVLGIICIISAVIGMMVIILRNIGQKLNWTI